MNFKTFAQCGMLVSSLLCSAALTAGTIKFKDPAGDDVGHGSLIYPTDAAYKPGAFDLRELQVAPKGKKIDFSAKLQAKLEDPWGMGVGFSMQMIFIFIDTDGKPGSGHTEGLPGLNIRFAEKDAWDKVVILSPQKKARVLGEIRTKASQFASDIVVAERTKGKGKKIKGSVKLADLGGGDPEKWGYQVVVQSNEGFPGKNDLLTRKVNEYEGQHRFGGGNDSDCDPHAIDIIAGTGSGDKKEIELQKKMLSYQCSEEGESVQVATLNMVRK